jgi:hypothetical protein
MGISCGKTRALIKQNQILININKNLQNNMEEQTKKNNELEHLIDDLNINYNMLETQHVVLMNKINLYNDNLEKENKQLLGDIHYLEDELKTYKTL